MVASLLTMVSCGNDASVVEYDDNPAEQQQVQICFTISMAGSTTRTRAITWGDSYDSETATYNENAIDPDKFLVLVFDTSGNILDQLDILSCTCASDNADTYDVVGSLTVESSYIVNNKLSCKLVVLANYDNAVDASSISTLSDISANTFAYANHTTANIASGAAQIPMFGVATLSNLYMSAGYRTDAGTVYMLRAMAKIRVKLGDRDSNADGVVSSEEEFAITSATLTNCNKNGYIVPRGYADVSNTKELAMVDLKELDWANDNTFKPYPQSGTPTTQTLTLQKESDTEYYLYLPEYDISNGRPTFSIKFDFQTSSASAYTFVFDSYDVNGEAKEIENYHIERNHIYTFTIKKNKGTLNFQVENDKWANTFDNEYTFE